MPLIIADRVRETTTTSGTGPITLAGPYLGFQAFSVIGNGNTTYYVIIDAPNLAWEVGIGTYASVGNTLARTTVLASSNAGSLVNLGAGPKDVILTQPARRSVLVQEGGSGLLAGTTAFTANGIPYANSTSTLTTGSALTFDGATFINTAGPIGAAGFTALASGGEGGQIGLQNPTNTGDVAALDVLNATTARLFTQVNNAALLIGQLSGTGGTTRFFTAAAERMRIDNTGNVGIGMSSPPSRLTVLNASATDPLTVELRGQRNFVAETHGATAIVATSNQTRNSHDFGAIRFEQNPATIDGAGALLRLFAGGSSSSFAANTEFIRGTAITGANGVDSIQFRTLGNERMRIDSSGNVGIGVSAPVSKLDVVDTNCIIFSRGSAGYGSFFAVGSGTNQAYLFLGNAGGEKGRITSEDGGALTFSNTTSSTERMRIDSAGNVGIGTSSPGAVLHTLRTSTGAATVGAFLQNSDTTTGTEVRLAFAANTNVLSADRYGWIGYVNTGGTNGGALTFATTPGGTTATERMRIDGDGNVGIGTSSPGDKLEIGGAGAGIIMASPDGTRYRITVSNLGVLTVAAV
jgi:hypothetical protein